MLSDKVQKALNGRLNAEVYSSYLYFSMSAYSAARNFTGFASWLQIQAEEELKHAEKFYKHIIDRGGAVKLVEVPAPPCEWETMAAVFDSAVTHERQITSLINELVEGAAKERDHTTNVFLNWAVTEQVEEERSATEMLGRIKMAGSSAGSLLYLDNEAGKRKRA